jgi:hypothetical protein
MLRMLIVIGVVAVLGASGPWAALAVKGETLTVPFSLGTTGVETTQSYAGRVTITVSGTGQAAGSQSSDAFYIFTDSAGNPVTPFHVSDYYNFGLWVNGGPVDNYLNAIPPYNDAHTYTFSIVVRGGRIVFAFGVGDTFTSDNTGAFTVTIRQGNGH